MCRNSMHENHTEEAVQSQKLGRSMNLGNLNSKGKLISDVISQMHGDISDRYTPRNEFTEVKQMNCTVALPRSLKSKAESKTSALERMVMLMRSLLQLHNPLCVRASNRC